MKSGFHSFPQTQSIRNHQFRNFLPEIHSRGQNSIDSWSPREVKMSGDFGIGRDCSVDIEEHQRIRAMCRELRKEKDILRESLLREQSVNAELIRRFESDATAASEQHRKDKKYIEELERELQNSSQELGFLQDQLNLRNMEANCMGEHVHNLEKKLPLVENLQQKLKLLKEELVHCDSKRLFFMRQLDNKEAELENCMLQIEKQEAAVSSIQLESQCEIESMKLDMEALEQRCFEAERFSEQAVQEKVQMDTLFNIQFLEAQQTISCLEKENNELQEKLVTSERNIREHFSKIEEHLDEWLRKKAGLGFHLPCQSDSLLINLGNEVTLLNKMSNYEELHPFLSKLAVVTAWDGNVKDEMEKMSKQIREAEGLVTQLKEDLREEKLKAREEAEDLTQEMAEFRYQITEMLEEERNHRSLIEQASLRRIQELEAEVHAEKLKSSKATRHFREAHELAKARAVEIQHLKNTLENCHGCKDREDSSGTESSCCSHCVVSGSSLECLTEDLSDVEASATDCAANDMFNQARIGWYSDEDAVSKDEKTSNLDNGIHD